MASVLAIVQAGVLGAMVYGYAVDDAVPPLYSVIAALFALGVAVYFFFISDPVS